MRRLGGSTLSHSQPQRGSATGLHGPSSPLDPLTRSTGGSTRHAAAVDVDVDVDVVTEASTARHFFLLSLWSLCTPLQAAFGSLALSSLPHDTCLTCLLPGKPLPGRVTTQDRACMRQSLDPLVCSARRALTRRLNLPSRGVKEPLRKRVCPALHRCRSLTSSSQVLMTDLFEDLIPQGTRYIDDKGRREKKKEALGLRDPFKLEAKVGAFQNRMDIHAPPPFPIPPSPSTHDADRPSQAGLGYSGCWMLLLTCVFLSQA